MFETLDSFAHELGWMIITLAVVGGYIWLAVKSPVLGWITLQAIMAAWGLATAGVGLFMLFHKIDDGEIFEGILCAGAAALLAIPWFFAAREFYPATFPPKPHHRRLWI
jgi:hypothetical protein